MKPYGVLVELGADAVLQRQTEVRRHVQERAQRLTGHVRAADQIGVVATGVVTSRRPVRVRERPHVPHHAAVLAEQAREVERDEGLVDAELRLQIAVAPVGEVVRAQQHVGRGAVVAVGKMKLRPGAAEIVRVAPVRVNGVGDLRRGVQLGAVIDLVRKRGPFARAKAQAERSANVALEVELQGVRAMRHGRGLTGADDQVTRRERTGREAQPSRLARCFGLWLLLCGRRGIRVHQSRHKQPKQQGQPRGNRDMGAAHDGTDLHSALPLLQGAQQGRALKNGGCVKAEAGRKSRAPGVQRTSTS